MKKLIIIGNGFDLAHGYPTGYRSFIIWLVKKEIISMQEDFHVKRRDFPLFSCSINHSLANLPTYLDENVLNILRHCEVRPNIDVSFNGKSLMNMERGRTVPITLRAETQFGVILLKSSCDSWVDIEQTYYQCLKAILKETKQRTIAKKREDVNKLNDQLMYLCKNLSVYLSSLQPKAELYAYREIIDMPIDQKSLFTAFNKRMPHNYHHADTYILNFNYTNFITEYLEPNKVTVNQIHGSIIDVDNPMIFGYGDELDEDFQAMENEEVKGFLMHVKSLWYLRTKNYRDLLRFIESENFQVQIIGHSCGRSDRTLLNMIFEHENCNSINIYYHKRKDGSDNFNELSEEISRQFKDKLKLRKRVLPKDSGNILPQYDAGEKIS